jgi:hypothetical protein
MPSSKTTPLPAGLSPFEKSVSKSLDIQGSFRKVTEKAILQAIRDNKVLFEVEFPPLLGGDKTKTQFGK